MLNRREIMNLVATTSAASAMASSPYSSLMKKTCAEETTTGHDHPIIDTNISLFRWPFRRLPLDSIDALYSKLRELNITQAWAGSFEGLLHRDITSVNERLHAACRKHVGLVPIGSINLALPDWESDLQRCFEQMDMPGVRLHPNYHGYTLNDVRFRELLVRATESGKFVQIAISMEDTRTQSTAVQFNDVDPEPLVKLVPDVPNARVQLLNYRPRSPQLERLAETPGIYFDTARIEGTDGVPKLIEIASAGKILFGTHAPFLIPEASLIRIHEAGLTTNAALRAILVDNALFLGKGQAV